MTSDLATTTRVTGTPVVLLHALFTDSSLWRAQEKALSAAGHPVIAPDQRGFGTAPLGTAAPSLNVVADDLARLLDALGIDHVVVAGTSMGGYATMSFLRRHRDRVKGLALVATRATADDAVMRERRERFAGLVVDRDTGPRLLSTTIPSLIGATNRRDRPEVVARLMAGASSMDPAAVAWAQHAMAAREASLDVLGAADVPAVVIVGGEDELVRCDEAGRTASALPRGRLVVLPQVGHLPPLEAPATVSAALLDVLREVEGGVLDTASTTAFGQGGDGTTGKVNKRAPTRAHPTTPP